MALASAFLTFTTAVVAVAGTAVDPGVAIPDNCRSILLFSTTAFIYGIAAAGAGALTLGTNATLVLANTPLTLVIGLKSERGDASSPNGIVYAGYANSTPTIYITYSNVFGQA